MDTAVQLSSTADADKSDDDGDDDDDARGKDAADGKTGGHHLAHSVRDLVSTTLTLSSKKNKKKQQATVKPIKASDEKTLDAAIAMANALAAKSMQDLNKGGHLQSEDFYDGGPPAPSPLTPNSPSKKFTFWFPGKSSPKGERRTFTEEVKSNSDASSLLTPGAIDAYRYKFNMKNITINFNKHCFNTVER